MTGLNRRVTDRPAGVVFALLVVACFVAFFLTQHLKHTPTVVQRFQLTPFFSPTPAGHIKEEHISFKLAREDKVTVKIIDSNNHVVATLVRDRPVERYKQFSLRWNGRTGTAHRVTVSGARGARTITLIPANSGPPASAGEYRVRLFLHDRRRSVLSPRSFTLVRP